MVVTGDSEMNKHDLCVRETGQWEGLGMRLASSSTVFGCTIFIQKRWTQTSDKPL